MNEARERELLDVVLAIELPPQFRSKLRERYDGVLKETLCSVVIYPEGLDVESYKLGMPGGYAAVKVSRGGAYGVGVVTMTAGWCLQFGDGVYETSDAHRAVTCALGAVRCALQEQDRSNREG